MGCGPTVLCWFKMEWGRLKPGICTMRAARAWRWSRCGPLLCGAGRPRGVDLAEAETLGESWCVSAGWRLGKLRWCFHGPGRSLISGLTGNTPSAKNASAIWTLCGILSAMAFVPSGIDARVQKRQRAVRPVAAVSGTRPGGVRSTA